MIKTVDTVTEGQACTAHIGLSALIEEIGEDALGSITFGTCDNGALYDSVKLKKLLDAKDTDIIV